MNSSLRNKCALLCLLALVGAGCQTRLSPTTNDSKGEGTFSVPVHEIEGVPAPADTAPAPFVSKIQPVTPTTTIAFIPGFQFKYPVDPKSELCTLAPSTSDIGSVDYPIAPEYEVYDHFLGALLTQYQCPKNRSDEAIGTSGLYDLGISLRIKPSASPELLLTLKAIGFYCNEEPSGNMCEHWRLDGTAPVYNIIHLEPYTKEIQNSDCINCG